MKQVTFLLLLTLACEAVSYGIVEMYGLPSADVCRNCTCLDCLCVQSTKECRKCTRESLIVKIVIERADGMCHAVKFENAHPLLDTDALESLSYMAVLCKDGLFINADGATKEECDGRAIGLTTSFERGELHARTQQCIRSGDGSYLMYRCDDDPPVRESAHQPRKQILPRMPDRSAFQIFLSEVSQSVPLIVPPCLLIIFMFRDKFRTVRKYFAMLAALTISASLLFMYALSDQVT
eukprot:TRINITY_DN9780_c0_g1_i1.p1 TRINITY_DN9780_c0_g1~~TRINITY_DN9780_c0_g1_i1.p1  ORF type:complete len:237 (+),score=12.69 TRINITY_DN9780_c0_g1_i1:43-753(+)